jgi:hypothetical protein
MRSHSPRNAPEVQSSHAPLWLAASEGRRLQRPATEPVGDIDGPETPMVVEFFGITEEEQRAALAAFPGGKRFVLASATHKH